MVDLIPKIKNKTTIIKILSLFFVVVLIIIAFYTNYNNNQKQNSNLEDLDSKYSQLIQEQNKKDSDGDGLKDWEEELRGFNPLMADSNNNGINDKEELENQKLLGQIKSQQKNKIEIIPIVENINSNPKEVVLLESIQNKINEKSIVLEPTKTPNLFEVSPNKGLTGLSVTLRGFNFDPLKNTVHAGYAVFHDVPSSDGVTINFDINPVFPEGFKGWDFPVEYWIYVENKNGISEPVKFSLLF